MRLKSALKKLYRNIKLIKSADAAFALSSREEDGRAIEHIALTRKALGPLLQYRFGIELTLLEIFLRASREGISEDDYDWVGLRNSILAAYEYNPAEKLHLLVYLEELATTAGATLALADVVTALPSGQPVAHRLLRRFPKLSTPA